MGFQQEMWRVYFSRGKKKTGKEKKKKATFKKRNRISQTGRGKWVRLKREKPKPELSLNKKRQNSGAEHKDPVAWDPVICQGEEQVTGKD